LGVAVVGCGTISNQYLTNLTAFGDIAVVATADIEVDRAQAQAEKYGVPHAGTVAEALARADVELVVNLTIPAAHADVANAAVSAGKHVWNEKPLTTDHDSGAALLKAAEQAGVRVGGAPDTFLGAGLQTARRLIEEGVIGEPQTALTLMQSPGPESWHPSPEFLFARGAGPLFDIGPYYLTTLATFFGAASRVSAVGRRSRDHRVIGSGPKAGAEFPVEVPTHVAALIEYEAGPAADSIFSFDSPAPRTGFVEITGTEAVMAVPDPNRFDGAVKIRARGADEWEERPAVGATETRGVGVLEMARAIRAGRPHRASGELTLHVLDTMLAIEEAAATGAWVAVRSGFDQPPPLPADWTTKERTEA
jgi:predicted dehydrogenase